MATLLLAGKDADSYLLKDRQDNPMTTNRVKRWHRDGFMLAAMFALMASLIQPLLWYWILIYCILIRLTFFDLVFNDWSSLPITYLGGTAWADRMFVKIFGVQGAVKKSITFFIILIILNSIKHV